VLFLWVQRPQGERTATGREILMAEHRWIFGESSGNTTYDSLGQVNGTLFNARRAGPGRYGLGNVLELQQSPDSYVDFGTGAGQFGTATFTISLWFSTTTLPLVDIVGNRTSTSHGNFSSLRLAGDNPTVGTGQLVAEADQDANGTNYVAAVSKGPALNDGAWHHVAVVRGGPSLSLYVDGELSGQGVGKGVANIASNNPWRLGRSLATDTSPSAKFCDLGVYSKELGPEEIYHIYCFH